MAGNSSTSGPLRETISVPASPSLPIEFTMPKFRIVIEDSRSGQEYWGRDGLNRVAIERIVALVNSVGAHELEAGKLPTGKNAGRELSRWARDVAHVFDRKPAKAAPRTALTVKPRARGR